MTAPVFLPADFENAVLAVKPKLKNRIDCILTLRCPDQWVGMAEWTEGGFKFLGAKADLDFSFRRDLNACDIPDKRLVVILESPHKDEFDIQQDKAHGPARGASGRNIRSSLNFPTFEFRNHANLRIGDSYALVLMNAIPYQCSLGSNLRKYDGRLDCNTVFRECWKMGRLDFAGRLETAVTSETLLINACTKGETQGDRSGPWLRDLVEEEIRSCKKSPKAHLRRFHPSILPNWRSGKGWEPSS